MTSKKGIAQIKLWLYNCVKLSYEAMAATRPRMLTVRASDGEKLKIKSIAEAKGLTISQYIWKILDEAIANEAREVA